MPSSLSTTSNQSPTKSAREDTGKAFRVTVYLNDLKYNVYIQGKAFKICSSKVGSKLYIPIITAKASKTKAIETGMMLLIMNMKKQLLCIFFIDLYSPR